eukprot:jgi/Astpho2/2907/e_gw1.00050.290.1_t
MVCYVLVPTECLSRAPATSMFDLQAEAATAYADRDFSAATQKLNELVENEPNSSRWHEMRAQVLVDGKNFKAAVDDFDAALQEVPGSERLDRARLTAGRALAHEGLSQWQSALDDYNAALQLSKDAGLVDPFVVNSRGNVHASLGHWQDARDDYLAAAELFQRALSLSCVQTVKLYFAGAVFASSNAALMLAQLGDEEAAVKEMQRIARRAPGSADMRAALAALYWHRGQQELAESEWEFACDKINVGCSKFQSSDWLGRIRRWPPKMVELMHDFLALQQHVETS